MKITGYKFRGGLHPETATVTQVLAHAGLTSPHTGKPLSEAMVLGIGGGLGAGYILWEFERWNAVIPVFGFRNNWQYPVKFMSALADRLGARFEIYETGGAKKAAEQLAAALAVGQPAICWVDQALLPYFHLPEGHNGCFGHVVTVVGLEDGAPDGATALLDDRAKKPWTLSAEELAAARGRIPSYKNRLMTVSLPKRLELASAVRAGLRDCAEHLAKSSDSFSLPVLRKWARTMTDPKHKKGWPKVFAKPVGLYSALRSLYEEVEPGAGSAGGNLRQLYADFLREAAAVTDNSSLTEVAVLYRKAAKLWSGLAHAALPPAIEPLAEARALIDRRAELFRRQGGAAGEELAEIGARLNAEYERYNRKFPGSQAEIAALFAELQERLEAIYALEVEANAALTGALAG